MALLGARQVGKTTLAKTIAQSQNSVYLDLEAPEDLLKLNDPNHLSRKSQRQTYHIRRNSARPRIVYGVARTYRQEQGTRSKISAISIVRFCLD